VTGRGRVLVVDDHPLVLSFLCDVVEYLGHDASTAASGAEAIAALATVQPHLVFLDLLMPGIPGLEVLNYIRQHHPTVPVIVITASIDQKIAHEARAAGAFAVVEKPINLDALRGLVAQAMEMAPPA
jgi:CheY-like chemotaxis protein